MTTDELSKIRFDLINKQVYFAFRQTNNNLTIGHKLLTHIIFTVKGYSYKVENYNNHEFGKVFESKTALIKYLEETLIDI